MELTVSTFPKTRTLLMPVAGTLVHVPQLGEMGRAAADSIRWPDGFQSDLEINRDNGRIRLRFETDVFMSDADRLLREITERRTALDEFRGNSKLLSRRPVEDPFRPLPQNEGAVRRIIEAKAILVSLMLTDKVKALASDALTGPHGSLESRISGVLSSKAISLCAGLLDLSKADTLRLACTALAEEMRRLGSLRVPEIGNPSAPFQTLSINDPTLLAGHSVTSSVESMEILVSNYIQRSRIYWARVDENKLYNNDDLETLRKWGVINSVSEVGSSALSDIISRLDDAWNSFTSMREMIGIAQKMVRGICYKGMDCWLRSRWPVFDPLENDASAKWLAKSVASELGLNAAVAEGHYLTWSRVQSFALKYLLLDLNQTANIVGDDGKLLAYALEVASAQAAEHVLATQMEFKARKLFGGTIFRLNSFAIPQLLEKEFEERDLGEGTRAVNAALMDPRNAQQAQLSVRTWRRKFQKAFSRRRPNDPLLILDGFENLADAATDQIEQMQAALYNVNTLNELNSIIRAMQVRMNADAVNKGNVDVPIGTRVDSVFVSVGEHVVEGRPVFSVVEQFRCNCRVFVTSEEMAGLDLSPAAVWQIEVDNKAELAPGIQAVAIIARVEPERDGRWIIELELLAVIDLRMDGIMNLPSYLPLSFRFAGVTESVHEESIRTVESILTSYEKRHIKFLARVH